MSRTLCLVMSFLLCGPLFAAAQINLSYVCIFSKNKDWDKEQSDTKKGQWPPSLNFEKARTWGDLEAQIEPHCGPGRLLWRGRYPGKDHPFAQPKSYGDYGPFLMYVPLDAYDGDPVVQSELDQAGIPSQDVLLTYVEWVERLGAMKWKESDVFWDLLPDFVKAHPQVTTLHRFMEAYTRHQKLSGPEREVNLTKTYCWGHEEGPFPFTAPARTWRDFEDALNLAMGPGRLKVNGALAELDKPFEGKKGAEVTFETICPATGATLIKLASLSGFLARKERERARQVIEQERNNPVNALDKAPFFDRIEDYLKTHHP